MSAKRKSLAQQKPQPIGGNIWDVLSHVLKVSHLTRGHSIAHQFKTNQILSDYILKKFRTRRLRLAFSREQVHISPIAPEGGSVNDGIDPVLATLSYSSEDEAVTMVNGAGPDALMAKLDIEAAF
uniref:Uncharacterized protein n=1 Tax=Amphimedon queenslandica TaxID=400682 RepID=A0A1X7TTI4_AMPQE